MSLTRPDPFLSKWAENGKRFDIADSVSDTANGKANIQTGFPEITMQSVINGGVPPWGQDHNGILYQITQAVQWTQSGGLPTFNQAFVDRNGGYSVGSILQGSDSSKPWVLWQSTVDNNMNDPNANAIDIKIPMNGWVRYPVISGVEGSSLYYDKQGRLEIASATVNLERWVSSSVGSDEDGKGTKERPYFSIMKAINDTPGSGSVTIYIRDKDTHYWSPEGKVDNNGGYIDIGSRKLKIFPYDYDYETPSLTDEQRDTNRYKKIDRELGAKFNDGTSAYCLSDTCLAQNGIARPTLVLVWKYQESIVGENQKILTNTQFCGINGVSGDYSFYLYSTKVMIHNIVEFTSSALPLTTGWGWNGGSYQFIGCIFENMPKPLDDPNNKDYKVAQYLLGGGGNEVTSYSFPYRNFFKDVPTSTKFIAFPSNLSINVNLYDHGEEEMIDLAGNPTGYIVMETNTYNFLGNENIYWNGLDIIETPSKRYAYINPNFEIK